MNVIHTEEEAFFILVEMTIPRLSDQNQSVPLKRVGEKVAMKVLNVKSKTTFQRLRNEGKIGFSQPMHKVILYDRESLITYIEKHTEKPFTILAMSDEL